MKAIVSQGFEFVNKNKRHIVACFLEASPRLELGVRILQTLALPLGYDAVCASIICAQSFGAGDGVAIFDGNLAVRTRAGLCILHPSLREAESRLMTYIVFKFSTLFFLHNRLERETGFGPATFTLAR